MRRVIGSTLAVVTLTIGSACRIDFGWTTLPTAPSPPGSGLVPVETIALGRPFNGNIFGRDPFCTLPDGRFGPCRRLRLVAPFGGLLRVSVSWNGGRHALAFALVNRTVCCASPLVAACDVFGGTAYDIVIVLLDLHGGAIPQSASQPFALVAALE